MAQKQDELLDHEYDGIREFDNPLPRWWMWLFYGTIVFAVVYGPYYLLGLGHSSAQMYQAEMRGMGGGPGMPHSGGGTMGGGMMGGGSGAAGGGAAGSGGDAGASIADPSVVGSAEAIAAGKAIFLQNCLPCHGDKGQGLIGPNLTDRFWLHGNRFEDTVQVIANGVPDKGMIAWRAMLNPQKINQAAAFLMTLRGTNPPNPKTPQGQEYPE